MKKTIRIQDRQGKVFAEFEVEVPEGVSDEDVEKGVSITIKAHLQVLKRLLRQTG